jgi:NAD(P)-dependent dehydrogenase (short-subunit alcohol dehydrogenase family)
MFDLSGRVALVSGAADSLGKGTSLAMAEAGADVVLADIDEAGVQATAAEIESLKKKVLPVVCDVSQPEQI